MAMTLFLSNTDDYDGSELVLLTDDRYIKLDKEAVFYPASIVHWVSLSKEGKGWPW